METETMSEHAHADALYAALKACVAEMVRREVAAQLAEASRRAETAAQGLSAQRPPADAPALGRDRVAYSVKDAAKLTGWPETTLYDMVERGQIPVVRGGATGRSIRILARDLEAFLLAGGVERAE